MRTSNKLAFRAELLVGIAGVSVMFAGGSSAPQPRDQQDFPNAFGTSRTISMNGRIDENNPFFKDLGTNGRKCVTCHQPGESWSVSTAGIRERFEKTRGEDPIFRLVDGANSPTADVRTLEARRRAYNMLLNHGVFRIERPIPANAEFNLVDVDDPYGHATAAGLSLFRRPLPSTNLRFISTVMWDGREVNSATPMTIANSAQKNADILMASLSGQSQDATHDHAQGTRILSLLERQQIVNFEMGLTTAQVSDRGAGQLTDNGALGGPANLQQFPFYIGINDNVADPEGPFVPESMTLYNAWNNLPVSSRRRTGDPDASRSAIARGETVFNTKQIEIRDVKGLNDNAYFGKPAVVMGTCTTCHNTPGVGDHSLAIALNIGIADASRRAPDMPLYTLQNKTTGEITRTMDPGLALSTGKWNDIGRFKGPVLRGLAARAPYFHDGSAADLGAVLDFYHTRFNVTFTDQEKSDLIAFLKSL